MPNLDSDNDGGGESLSLYPQANFHGLIKPLIRWLNFPSNPLTLSLLTFVIMGLLAMLILPYIPIQQSTADGNVFYSYGHLPFWSIFVFALALAVINFLIQNFFPE